MNGFQGESHGTFRHWLYAVARNKLRMKLRHHFADRRDVRRGAGVAIEDVDPSVLATYHRVFTPSAIAATHEEIGRFEAAFDELPADYREIISLTRIMGLSHTEAASQMGRSAQAARKLLSRAVARLALLLAQRPGSGSTPEGGPPTPRTPTEDA